MSRGPRRGASAKKPRPDSRLGEQMDPGADNPTVDRPYDDPRESDFIQDVMDGLGDEGDERRRYRRHCRINCSFCGSEAVDEIGGEPVCRECASDEMAVESEEWLWG